MRLPHRSHRARDAIGARGEEEHARVLVLLQIIEAALNGRRVIRLPIANGAIIRFHVFPTGERSDKFIGAEQAGQQETAQHTGQAHEDTGIHRWSSFG